LELIYISFKKPGYSSARTPNLHLDEWLTVNFQIDSQNSYLFIYNTFIKNSLHVSSITLLIFRSST